MINPKSLNPELLPSVPIEHRAQLPSEPSIYFAIDSLGQIQYIGKSVNPQQRWMSHHRYPQLSVMGGVRIAYIQVEESLLLEVERALIEWFDPPLNGRKSSPETSLHTKEKVARTSITIPEELLEWFREYCDDQRRSVSAQITLMIKELRKEEVKV